jgi:hypothetical protein
MVGKIYHVSVTNVEDLTLGFYLVSSPSYVPPEIRTQVMIRSKSFN